ncbi:MAG: hypothetical protein ACREO0_14725 [Pseudoxanthomonas sp.]
MKKWNLAVVFVVALAGSISFSTPSYAQSMPEGDCTASGGSSTTCVTRDYRPLHNVTVETTTTYTWTFNTSTGTWAWSVVSVSLRTLPGDTRIEQ